MRRELVFLKKNVGKRRKVKTLWLIDINDPFGKPTRKGLNSLLDACIRKKAK
jgi:hypothetical protein